MKSLQVVVRKAVGDLLESGGPAGRRASLNFKADKAALQVCVCVCVCVCSCAECVAAHAVYHGAHVTEQCCHVPRV